MKNISRRNFLKTAGITAGVTAMGNPVLPQTGPNAMLRRPIPSSGEEIPIVGLGTWQQFDVDENSAEAGQLAQVLKNVLAKGGCLIDSSPMYGRAEAMIGTLTQAGGQADDFFYATKVWTSGKLEGIRQMEDSFRKMKRKTMDLMQVHNLLDVETHLTTLKLWKEQKKVRYIGATHYSSSAHPTLEQLIARHRLDFLQFNFNLGDRNAEKRLLPAAADKGVAVIINEPFGSGTLFRRVRGKELPEWAKDWEINSWAQFFLKYILAHPAVTCAIPGTSNPNHATDNMSAGFGVLPDEAGRKKMAAYFDAL